MTEELCLIDTDVLSYILKQREPVYQKSQEYLKTHGKFTISCITYYECFRGYKAVDATKRLQVFQEFLNLTDVLYLDRAILDKAGEIYGVLKQKGMLPGEFDIFIGATTLVQHLTLVTNNAKHYQALQEYFSLNISNWMNR